jgi:hypothetical protein
VKTDKKRVWWVGAGVITIGVVLFWNWWHRPLSPREVAEKFRDCTISADAACVQSLLSHTDLEDNAVTSASLQAFLEKYIKPYFPNPVPTAFEFIGEPENVLVFSGQIATSRGNSDYNVTVGPTDQGYRAVDGYSQIVLLAAGLPKQKDLPQGPSRLRLLAAQIRLLTPDLERFGFKGIRPKPGDALQTWDQFSTDMVARADRAELGTTNLR